MSAYIARAVMAAAALSACGAGLHGSPSGATEPQPRSEAAMAYDAHTGELVLFGGAAERSLGDTWVWQDGRWQQRDPAQSPPARENAALGYDGRRGELVLFGGDSVGPDGKVGLHTDTWTWDGSTWTQRHPAHHPASGTTPLMAYDEARGMLVLVGQRAEDTTSRADTGWPTVETWTWRDGDWHAESAEGAPLGDSPGVGGRSGLPEDGAARPVCCGPDFSGSAGMGWDPVLGRVLYVEHNVDGEAPLPRGGLLTWSWGGAWRLEHPAQMPAETAQPLVAQDRSGVVLLANDGTTWQWDGHTWTRRPVAGPPRRDDATVAYDGSTDVVRVFGGVAENPGGVYGDTWTWDGAGWSRSAGPPQAQEVPQPRAVKPASGISRERAVEIARKAFPEMGRVTRVEDGPRSRFGTSSAGSADGRVWVWAVVFGDAEVPAQGCGGAPAGSTPGPTCPPPPRGLVVMLNYRTGQQLLAMSPAPAWLLASPSP